jgi:class 3 adenylate cyclase
MATRSIVFVDLTGSTGVFESLGNEKATKTITRMTSWIGDSCVAYGGRVVKKLGDGVLASFEHPAHAVTAVTNLQREHHARLAKWPTELHMKLKIGMATGDVIEVDDDCYGDAVNVAARLSDLSGPEEIWATDTVIEQLPPHDNFRYRSLGTMVIRGKQIGQVVYRVEWADNQASEFFTVLASLSPPTAPLKALAHKLEPRQIQLTWIDTNVTFDTAQLPIVIGRGAEANLRVTDKRVSRSHVCVEWRSGNFVLSDLSSFGSWVRFKSTQAVVPLRRSECALTDSGDIALGAGFDDFTTPTVNFQLIY